MNTDELEHALLRAERRVLEIQTKLHRWAGDDPHRRFDDLFNLVADPGFLLVAWDRVRGNKGARTPGVDGQTAYYVEAEVGVEVFLDQLRTELKDRSFRPLRGHAHAAAKSFEAAYGVKFGKAVAKLTDDLDELLAFYDYPAEH